VSLCLCGDLLVFPHSIGAQEVSSGVAHRTARAKVAALEAGGFHPGGAEPGAPADAEEQEDDAGSNHVRGHGETTGSPFARVPKVLLTAVVGTGSRQFIEEETGRNWFFRESNGVPLPCSGRNGNPVWIRPDWSYVEENMPVPAEERSGAHCREVLGKYALILGKDTRSTAPSIPISWGRILPMAAVSVGDKDLEVLYRTVKMERRSIFIKA